LCTNLQKQVLDLEKAKDAQVKEIAGLKKRVQKFERKKEIKNYKGDASKQGRIKIVDETQWSAKIDEREVSTGVEDSVAPTILVTTTGKGVTTVIDELTLAQTLFEIKAAKPKVVTTAATTTTNTRPKARGVVVQEPTPLKKKDQAALHEEMARNLEAQLQAKLIEEGKMARKKEEEDNIALIESWENTQAMMKADRLLAERL
ncbi:hypothetical protein Tco_0095350, partial [Tanacetum coccineum]